MGLLSRSVGDFWTTRQDLSNLHRHPHAARDLGPSDRSHFGGCHVEPERGSELSFFERNHGFLYAPPSTSRREDPDAALANCNGGLGFVVVWASRNRTAQGGAGCGSGTTNRVRGLWRTAWCLPSRRVDAPREPAWCDGRHGLWVLHRTLFVARNTRSLDLVGSDRDSGDIHRRLDFQLVAVGRQKSPAEFAADPPKKVK